MTSLHIFPRKFQDRLQRRSLLKIISGLSNFDSSSVARVARAASVGDADFLDVACSPDLVNLAIEASGLPVCVSAVEPNLFGPAISAGASMVEIGNFDSFYPQGRFFDADEVLALTIQTRQLFPEILLSVTVPHVLPLDQQSQLAFDLVAEGADFIQTEGGVVSRPVSSGTLGLIEKAAPTLAAVQTISEAFREANLQTPIICSSGLTSVTVPMALVSGANGVGIGSAINRLESELAMSAVVKRLRIAVDSASTFTVDSVKS